MLKNRWQRWLKRRFAMQQDKQLLQRDILVFMHRDGLLYAVLIIITFIAGINYANNLILTLCFLLAAVLLMSFYLAFRQLYHLNIHCEIAELGQVGQELPLNITLTPAFRQLHVHLRCVFGQQRYKITALKQAQTIHLAAIPQQRGLYTCPRVMIYSVYPLGLIRAWTWLYPQQQVWIAPQAVTVNEEQYGLAVYRPENQAGIEDFSHLREFQQGDKLNRVAWQQYAKGRGLLVKQFEEYRQSQLRFDYYEMTSSLHEERLGQLMFLVERAYQQQFAFSLHLPTQTLALGYDEAHYLQAKLMLAQEP